jgi:hypothetical protein
MIKALKNIGRESVLLNITKAIYDKPIADITKKLKPFPLK